MRKFLKDKTINLIQSNIPKPTNSKQNYVHTPVQPTVVTPPVNDMHTTPTLWKQTKGWFCDNADAVESGKVTALNFLADVGEMAIGVSIGTSSLLAEPFTLGTSTLGVGLGGAMILHGADAFVTDMKALWVGHRDLSMTARILRHIPGVSHTQAESIDAKISIFNTLGAGGAKVVASRIVNNIPTLARAGQGFFSKGGSKPLVNHLSNVNAKTKAFISKSSVTLFGRMAAGKKPKYRLLLNIERISPNKVNKPFITNKALIEGWKPPYPDHLDIRKITTARKMKFYRMHADLERPAGRFLAREKEIKPYLNDPEALRLYFGLPKTPNYITEVNVPANTELFVGRVGPQPKFGLMTQSGFQYQIVGKIPLSSFTNTRPIIEPHLGLGLGY